MSNNFSDPLILDSVDPFRDWITAEGTGLITVKPRVVFSLVEERYGYGLPISILTPSSGLGSITTLEAAVMTSLLRLVGAKSILEIGTFLGYTTALFAANIPDDGSVVSIDLPESHPIDDAALTFSEDRIHASDTDNDEFLRAQQAGRGPIYVQSLEPGVQDRITLVKADSTTLSVTSPELPGAWDAVFIDGGHDRSTVESDTSLALDLVCGDGLILWHDFSSQIHGDVSEIVNERSKSQRIFHVQHTLLAIAAVGDFADKLTRGGEGS